jgi:branched-subunit amino acid aminotransferase/4-amino-4-deoxychorismate lyase
LHVRRFAGACADLLGIPTQETSTFVDAAVAQVPVEGRWFPRVELALDSGVPRFQLWIRPAPSREKAVRLWISKEPDRRLLPAVKGIDLNYLARLRHQARRAGADEALILSSDCRLCEGASTSILWWRADTLCAPPDAPSLLRGVTRTILWKAVRAAGLRVAFERPEALELDGLEVWAVNALHGIRPVIRWVGAPIEAGPGRRAPRWSAYLDRLAVPASEAPTSSRGRRTCAEGAAFGLASPLKPASPKYPSRQRR